ncbi:MAG: hypothetical protein KAH04_04925, partial [Psychrilyobacter sp.]|nr:hypothetical protein [Psychrilyobacter sp.]
MKKHLIILGCILMSGIALADDFDDFDDFGDSGESKSYFTTSLKGHIGYENRVNMQDGYKKDLPYLNLQPKIESEYVDLIGDFTLDKYDERLFVEEFYTRLYLGSKVQVEIGREKLIWGKGDKVHLVNSINATDYRDFINGEYREELIGEDMIRFLYTPFDDSEARIELVYTPEFNPNKYAEDGPWQPKSLKGLDAGLGKLGKSSNDFYPSQKQFKDDQFGARFTNSKDGIDFGFSYY